MADIKIFYATTVDWTVTVLNSLATSATRTAGVELASVDNSANLYADYMIGGVIYTGTGPTANKVIDIRVWGDFHSTPKYPDVIDGTASAETWTSEEVMLAGSILARRIRVNATSDQDYAIYPFSVAALFGDRCPRTWGLFIAHDTAVNLKSTGHSMNYTGVYHKVA